MKKIMSNLINFLMSNETCTLISFLLCGFTITLVFSIIFWFTRDNKRIEKIELDKCRKEIEEQNNHIYKLKEKIKLYEWKECKECKECNECECKELKGCELKELINNDQ